MEYVVVMQRENLYAMARLDSQGQADRLMEALREKGLRARLIARPI